MTVFDASALLAFLQGEAGAELVEQALTGASCCGAANWSEVAQKVGSAGASWAAARGVLLSYGLRVEPVTAEDAERAAQRWAPGDGLSLGDRLCLALGDRVGGPVLTADARWGSDRPVVQIR